MHICIEIIFSELNFRVCQIYKYHYCKDIFLEIDFWQVYFNSIFHICVTIVALAWYFLMHLFSAFMF